jgi:hypothetical protein
MGWAPIISAMSALVVRVAAWPSSKKGMTCPISASARSLPHSPGRDPGHHLACKHARQQHCRRRDADAREGEIERIEGARSDLDQKKGRAPEER